MRYLACLSLAILGCFAGCGGSTTPSAAGPSAAATTSDMKTPVAAPSEKPADPVGQVVYEFLEAVRMGQGENAAAKLLTPLALQKIKEQDLNIAPPGSPTARFRVNHIEMMPEGDRAVVQSIWTDVDADGKEYQEPIYCALRICEGQWRIHGMAQEMGPNEAPMVIDFENLDALIEQQPNQPAALGADRLAAPASEQPAASVATDPFNQPAPR